MRIVHLGDLGHILTREQIGAIGEVDILLIPVGGTFTIDAQEASEVVGQLKPKIIIPMHYKTPAIDLPIEGVERFLSGKKNIERRKELEVRKEELPEEEKIIVLEYET
jgi:L-ascorbate metabolism protein UlaG (beta-lactamase superfamily)